MKNPAFLCLLGVPLLTPAFTQAALLAQFTFDNDLSNELSGFGLTAVDNLVPFTPSDYTVEDVFGTSKTVLNITATQGLNLDVSALGNRTSYTIVMDVRSSTVGSYNKLMSLDGGTSDNGVYFYENALTFYPLGSGGPAIAPNEWVRVALSYDGTTMNLYSGDLDSFALASTGGDDSYYSLADTLQFLVDDSDTSRFENYPLQISGLWLFDTALTLENVNELPTIPEPASAGLLAGALALVVGLRRRK